MAYSMRYGGGRAGATVTRKNLLPAAVLTALALVHASGAGGSDIDEATRAYLAGDYDRALALFEPLAEEGNALARYP